jgi:Transposase DDE domain
MHPIETHRPQITFRPQAHYDFLQTTRPYQQTADFQSHYAARTGIEGTISQAVVAWAMRQSRYRGQLKTYLQHVATATTINIKRLSNCGNGLPFSKTPSSRFPILLAA